MMKRSRMALGCVGTAALVALTGCGLPGPGGDGTCDPSAPECAEGLVCDVFSDGEWRCAVPVLIRGQVRDIAVDAAIAGALIQAVDLNGAAAGTSGVSGEDGGYRLVVPAMRDSEGLPVEGVYTLRVQAADYQQFPTVIRPALPLDAASAVQTEDGWVIENAITTVGLIPLPGDTSRLGSISGTVTAERHAGILVVAERAGAALTGFSDSEGNFTIFNVPAGVYEVQGYAAGVQLTPEALSLEAGEELSGVTLAGSDRPLNSVSGNVQIVNAPGDAQTSVVLSLESLFDETSGRGTVPPGLRVGQVTGAFSIEQVPDGRYVILAAFENDDLVRDPDQTIGGTRIVRIEVPDPIMANDLVLSEGFKVTEALAVVGSGADAPEQIATLTPTLEWQDDSSEDGYEIRVFDAFGNEIWSDEMGPTSGSATVTRAYAGPGLEPGMFYQFRATSFREKNGVRTAISTTEDLKGVFYYLMSD